ncbi:PREDICTED: putative late blight resistance protein homolog R1B-17 isoform X3 [Ipomoea nil]|uniref:putative late blight resistance protein homolog R1B-17 isoform X3 n=1 Tax=Ipomoea nil TaxID=35883 RepID=UPI000900B12B|nr:PREDICTED: putative late blight resistance protein homolog R1B-17 isoform X3 [Ipomoea nil]
MVETNNSTYSKSSSMAFAVVTSLLEIVEKHLLQPNSSLVLYSREMVVSLSKKLRFVQAFLEEFGAKTDNWEANNKESLEAEILDVAAEAESKVESELGQVYVVANRGDSVVSACQKLHQTLQQVLKDFEDVEVKILMEKTNTNSLVIGSSTESSVQAYFTGSVGSITGKNTLEPENSVIVGFNKDIKKITYRLIRLPRVKRDVLTLVGLGGIGKTTLANMVYTNSLVAFHFPIRAWVVVSKEHNVKEMLVCLLGCIVPMTSEISNKDEEQLAEQLRKSLIGHRYLIVLDDVWSIAAWDAIQGCFPDNSNGSRILLTTRFTEVAVYTSEYLHAMKAQTQDDSWKLFSRKVFGLKQIVPQEYKSLGKRILDGCYGLPLAIVVMAGLLATLEGSIEIWRDAAKTLDGMDSAENRISRVLSLSYNYLPTHLKACLLYFGVFREDSDIPVKKLISLWVAEGFLKAKKKYKSMEKQAESYLHDLIDRSLVQANELSIDGKIKSCKVHDRLHEFCMREAKKENFLSVINGNHVQEDRRWMSFQSRSWPVTQTSYENHTFHKIRSILYSGNKDLYLSKCRLVNPHLKLLRVLDLSLVKYSHSMPIGIADLIHLRYLALNTIGSLYKFRLFKLQNLQTLAICSWIEGYPLQLPYGILDLPQLRHLHLERKSSQCLPSLVQGNLLTLYWLRVGSLDEKPNFRVVPNLKELGIYIEGEMTPSCLESLVHLRRLEKLKFDMGRVERFYLPSGFPPNLKKLTLRYTFLPWEEMSIIGQLPNLEVLKLKDFAFCGSKWEPTKWGFRGLKILLVERLDLKHWNANAEHFPVLELLVLKHCWDLKRVPVTFANIKTLKSIVLESCYSSLVTSANNIAGKVQRKENRILRVYDHGTKVGLSSILIHNSELLVLCLLIWWIDIIFIS